MNKKINVFKLCIILALVSLVACQTHQPLDGTAIDNMNVELHKGMKGNELIDQQRRGLPRQVSNALLPSFKQSYPSSYQERERRFDIAVKDVPAKTFFMGLVKGASLSMAVSPEIDGKITLNLKNVTVEEVLQTLEDVYGYAYQPMRNGFQIMPNKMKTQMYTVNYLDIDRKGESMININSGQVSNVANNSNNASSTTSSSTTTSSSNNQSSSSIGRVRTNSDTDFWKQLQVSLSNMIGTDNGRSVTVNSLAGVVVVRAMPAELKQVETYLDAVQNNSDRQVILEAKILEVVLNHNYQMGIDWKIFGANLQSISDFPNTEITQQAFPSAYKIDFNWNITNFTTTLQALSEQGNVQVLSSPRISAVNNQKAVIKVGSDEFYVTNVSTSTTQTVGSVTPTQDVELTPFFSGITLDVTPQIDVQGNVILHIHPSVSRVLDQQKNINLGNSGTLTLPLAKSTIRESDTVVHARDGQVIVIGGLMQNQTREDLAGLPFFADIPFFGTLLKNTKQSSQKSELVILLKPTIVKQKIWTKQVGDAWQDVNGLKRGFHIGGHPDVFGTEGEQPIKLGAPSGRYGREVTKGRK